MLLNFAIDILLFDLVTCKSRSSPGLSLFVLRYFSLVHFVKCIKNEIIFFPKK